MQARAFRFMAALAVSIVTLAGVTHANTITFTCRASGSGVDAPVDIDSDSCFSGPNGEIYCLDTSSHADYGLNCSPGGASTGTNLVEYDFVPGSGCNILGTTFPFASCTLAHSSKQGCKLKSVGGAEVDRNSNGDLTLATPSSTECVDLSSGPPFNFTGTSHTIITGGTGNNIGITGTVTGTFHGQVLTSDAAGHGLAWFVGTSTGTVTTP